MPPGDKEDLTRAEFRARTKNYILENGSKSIRLQVLPDGRLITVGEVDFMLFELVKVMN